MMIWIQRLLPQRLLCALIYRVSRSRVEWLKSALIRWFVGHYEVELDDAVIADLNEYPSFNAFFTRALRADSRPIDSGPDKLVSPVDGRLTIYGNIDRGNLIQAKGLSYAAAELLGGDSESAADLTGGVYGTIYLAPHNYHRIHMPCDAALVRATYVAGTRFGVNAATTTRIPRLFCRNERLVCWFTTAWGRFAMVLVGALNVSSISMSAYGEIPSGLDRTWTHSEPIAYAKGAELGRFNLGSTVILLLPQGAFSWLPRLRQGEALRLGEAIGTLSGISANPRNG